MAVPDIDLPTPKAPPYPGPQRPTGLEGGDPANVTIGPITTDDALAQWINVGAAALIWVDYRITSRYEQDRHVYMAGLNQPTPYTTIGSATLGAAFFQLAKPTTMWLIDWTASRFGQCPDIPHPNVFTQSEGSVFSPWVFMDDVLEPAMILLNPDGTTPIYRVSGTYVYGHRNPQDQLHADVTFPKPPWIENGYVRTIPQSALTPYLIDNVVGGG